MPDTSQTYAQSSYTSRTGTKAGGTGDLTTKKAIFRTYQLIWYLLGVVETILVFRFLLRLGSANQASAFVRFIYQTSGGLITPFRGVFPTPSIEGAIFEWTTVLAMIVYAVVAYGLVYLFQLVKPVEPEEVEEGITNP